MMLVNNNNFKMDISPSSWLDNLSLFHEMSPKEQVKLISKEEWSHLEIPEGPMYIFLHPKHEIDKQKPGEVNGWDCDARKAFGICFSGLTGFYQS